MKDFMAQFGARLVDNGYPVIPIMPGAKVPGHFRKGAWAAYPDWTRHCDRPTKTFEIDIWRRWPDCAVGIACGAVVGIDIDVPDASVAVALTDLAKQMLGETPCLRIGQAPKRLLVYRAATAFRGRKRHPLEVLARGQQFVAYAIHPVTGQPYAWPEEGLTDTPLADLPEITEAACDAFLDAAWDMVPAALRKTTLNMDSPSDTWRGPSDPRGTPEAVAAALAYLPNDDLPGNEWITIGAAIKAAIGEEGRQLWIDCSRKASKSGQSGRSDTPERRWATLKPHSAGAGKIYWLAEKRGWLPPPEIILNGNVAEQMAKPHPAAGLLEKLQAKRSKPENITPLPVPEEVLRPGGVLQMLMDECIRTALRPQPFLALGAAICAIGVLAGRKYRTPTDLRTNIYAAAIAESGGGKDHAPEVIRRCFDLAKLECFLGGETIASGRGMLSSLEQHPAKLFQIDEFGLFLNTVAGGRAPAHKAEIWSELLKLYSRAKGVYRGTEYANKKDAPRIDIHQPCVCFYGTTTPSTFWKALEHGAMVDGSLARFLVFATDINRPERNRTAGIIAPSPALLDALRLIACGPGEPPPAGNLPALHIAPMVATEEATPETIQMSAPAAALHDSKLIEEDAWARKVAGSHEAAIVNRLGENASKLALISAISRNPSRPEITAPDVSWGWALAEHSARSVLRDAQRFLAESPFEKRLNKALEIIGTHGPCSRREMFHRGLKLTAREFAELIETLVSNGAITEIQFGPSKTAGRPLGPRYILAQPIGEQDAGEAASDE
jgi:hypothetical protein